MFAVGQLCKEHAGGKSAITSAETFAVSLALGPNIEILVGKSCSPGV